mmetsp:Transcript_46442/g.118544  ORF Transcript_46442/g.118544 Transcript_46442/m.118544 type:complete len:205 (-) Transcript_46442:169-783(-)
MPRCPLPSRGQGAHHLVLGIELALPLAQGASLRVAQPLQVGVEVLLVQRRLGQRARHLAARKGVGAAGAVEVAPLGDVVHAAADGQQDGLVGVGAVVGGQLLGGQAQRLADAAHHGVLVAELVLPLLQVAQLLGCHLAEVTVQVLRLQRHLGQRARTLMARKEVVPAARPVEVPPLGHVEHATAHRQQDGLCHVRASVALQLLQ